MPLPWVSRALYDRVVADLEKSEKERKALLEMVLSNAEPETPVDKDEDIINPLTGKIDADKLRRMATRAKAVQAGLIAR